MHSWFTKKLNEMIGLAQYCQFPVLQAHFVLTKRAVDEMYGRTEDHHDLLADVLPLLITQAATNGQNDTRLHLERALASIEAPIKNRENIVKVNFDVQKSDLKHNNRSNN